MDRAATSRTASAASRVISLKPDRYVQAGDRVERGQKSGMIRIGSQVDLILPWRDSATPMVAPGDRVRAGESVLVC